MIKVYEMLVFVKLKKSIHLKNMAVEISSVLNHLFKQDIKLATNHKNGKFNNYCYSLLNPIEKGNPNYEKGSECFFSIRSIDRDFIFRIEDSLYDCENNLFETIRVTTQRLNLENIKRLYSITPSVSIVDRYTGMCALAEEVDNEYIKDRILVNTFKKYKEFINENIEPFDFIESVEFISNNNYTSNYKGGYIIGFKLRVSLKEDEKSQDFGRIILGCGLLEKNSLSFGYCGYDLKQRR